MDSRRNLLSALFVASAALPALLIGIITMRHLGVGAIAWAVNVGAMTVGVAVWLVGRGLPTPRWPTTILTVAIASIVAIVLPFASDGLLGVYRWIPLGALRLHASGIVAPLIILCVAATTSRRVGGAVLVSSIATLILAIQPDAAQATSLAAACAVVIGGSPTTKLRQILQGLALLLAVSATSFFRHDPLPPVAHVEEIFSLAASRGSIRAVMATAALALLPLPFFITWYRHRRVVALAIGVYVALTVLAPAWGTYPVPIMGSGASPILGYFIALVAAIGQPSHIERAPGGMRPPKI